MYDGTQQRMQAPQDVCIAHAHFTVGRVSSCQEPQPQFCLPRLWFMCAAVPVVPVVQVVAVFKDDGQRGHHLDDFIPKEELAKFMAQCGDNQLQQQVHLTLPQLLQLMQQATYVLSNHHW